MGKRIAQKRHDQGLTQRQVCEAIGIDDKYLSIIENAKSIPSLETVAKICDAINTTLDFVVFGLPDEHDRKNVDELYAQICNLSSSERRLIKATMKALKLEGE